MDGVLLLLRASMLCLYYLRSECTAAFERNLIAGAPYTSSTCLN